MFDRIRTRVLWLFRVPHDPDPPAGAPGSIRTFRAGRNYYKLRLLRWTVGQIGALIGIIFSLVFLEQLERSIEKVRYERPPAATKASGLEVKSEPAATPPTTATKKKKSDPRQDALVVTRRIAQKWPWWVFPVLTFLEWMGILVYVVQIPFTYAIARLDYELRWYIVTDRSLRIRAGLAAVQETTMSFANVQQVAVSQGPVQRLLGIADLRVQSAGGGGDHHERGGGESLHTGVFHGVDNAHEIRDLILERLRVFRQTGLGDPDDLPRHDTPAPLPPVLIGEAATLRAARELLEEAKALRRSIAQL
jgi:hypothetical protein